MHVVYTSIKMLYKERQGRTKSWKLGNYRCPTFFLLPCSGLEFDALAFKSCSTFAEASVLPRLYGAVPVSPGLCCSLRSGSGGCEEAPGFPVCAQPWALPARPSSPARTGPVPGWMYAASPQRTVASPPPPLTWTPHAACAAKEDGNERLSQQGNWFMGFVGFLQSAWLFKRSKPGGGVLAWGILTFWLLTWLL